MAQHINKAFAIVYHGFNTLAETFYSAIPNAIDQASETQQAKVDRLTLKLANLRNNMDSICTFSHEKEIDIWNAIQEA